MSSQVDIVDHVEREFERHSSFTGRSILVRSPGRINLIGEHTDYNEGFVLPAAVDRAIYMEVALREDSLVNLYSVDFEHTHSLDLEKPLEGGPPWANYLVGVLDQLVKKGYAIRGFDCVYSGDIPIGAGMSSSAAIETGLVFALNVLNSYGLEREELARIAQHAENEFVGVKCGIMDQFANLFGKAGSALHLDCRSLEFDYVPFEREDLKLVLCDTGIKHELASSEYNLRRQQCEEGVEALRKRAPDVRSLRDVTYEMLREHRSELDPTVYSRCLYVLDENKRVDEACELLRRQEYDRFGRLLYESHEGLRDLYEVSCNELDILVETGSGSDGVLGSRMMGGGFGGCTLNLVRKDAVGEFTERVARVYSAKTGKVPKVYECSLVDGTETLRLNGTGD